MQSAKQKSARKEQHKFQEGNAVKNQNTHQVEMEWVNMVTTKLVEWADKVVYIAVGEAKNMVYVKQMMGQHTHKVESDTFRQIKEEEPRIWAGINVWLVYIMKMEDRLIYLCKKYARQEKVILVEVYVRKREKKLTVEDNDMGIMVILVLVEVIVTVFEMEYITAGMQKRLTVEEGDINVPMEVVRTAIVEVVRTAITEGEYNTAEFEKKLTVDDVDINMSVEVVRTAIVEVVRTAITKGKYNTAEIEKNLTVKKRDINMFEDIRMTVDMVKFVVMVKEDFYNMIEDTNTGIVDNFKSVKVVGTVIIVGKMNIMIEVYVMQKEKLTVQGGDSNKFEAIHMMDAVIIKFVGVVINKEEYNMAEVHEELTVEEGDIHMIILQYVEVVKKEKGTKKQEDFWSFRDNGDKTLSYLGGLGR
jgi:hypothetical protein